MIPVFVNVGGSVLLGVIALLIGTWGVRNAGALVPASLPEQTRHSRERTLRRGARTCQVVGPALALAALALTVW
ncbi:hypothetical protein [Pseudonocardia sp. WMMC193]|uniref:hypothetical protein n=1 Tax=Pseudonocardia sp. WMMC193 TaxID=2911965 RepID=UPI001F374064|nr:hypothetical protein [Pseudonocardia sp. WMMC193]MCF7550722.1 hypothetical protein [Pseudonocardia sp. WMMC193]